MHNAHTQNPVASTLSPRRTHNAHVVGVWWRCHALPRARAGCPHTRPCCDTKAVSRHQAAQTMSRCLKWCHDTISKRAKSRPENGVAHQGCVETPGSPDHVAMPKMVSRHHLQKGQVATTKWGRDIASAQTRETRSRPQNRVAIPPPTGQVATPMASPFVATQK